MLGADAANATSNVYVIAMELQKKDMEKDMELQKKDMEQQKKDMEKDMELQKKDMEKDMELQKKDMEQQQKDMKKDMEQQQKDMKKDMEQQQKDMKKDMEHLVNFYKRQLSTLTQRYVLEALFRKVVQIVQYSKDGAIPSMLSKSDLNAMQNGKISMTDVNRLLTDNEHAEFRRKVWERIGLPQDLVIPTFDPKMMLYGQLSEMIHGSPGNYVFLPSNADELHIRFFSEVAKFFEKNIEYFDIVSANAGETLEADFFRKIKTNSTGKPRP
ncbi:hypothetical protein GUITHDRAFT_110490 [Guillardia theta CCMP2712]|uniref:Uncharacterized protein n=1 Tax=Guillardia theta (strain CCMP2712) TaxID=905079 RepID=L1J5A1_GUITC|nr:hypothetical protein GUITHDRAFT_110490 [Guillardia theta CCMP2712]EKX43691.1 hypothetical protein GUITHDRAFT_110490 [Guillardia theta CCMP2712]|eukprot:XP_005830671.1 hypothetical protein GUITHDRAFT_110490 [Guillardia theta CCMP2712]